MSLADDLTKEVGGIFREVWAERDGDKVPESEDLKLGNDAARLDAAVLYTDLSASTKLVDSFKPHFAAEVYKSFLHCSAKIVRAEGGTITAYDGDRLMAVFIGDSKETSAARAALKINWARVNIINPAIKKQYPGTDYSLRHVTGVDVSKLFVARTGIRGANDLVWVGRAANHAAKMSTFSSDFASRISGEVYKAMSASVQKSHDGRPMWESVTWTDMGRTIYRSTWMWSV
jgi:class 3 adenylate cyclase